MDQDIEQETDPAYTAARDSQGREAPADAYETPEGAQLALVNELEAGLASELEDRYQLVMAEGRAHATERYPKTTEAHLWWAALGGYLAGVFDLVVGDIGGLERFVQAEPNRPIEEVSMGLVASMQADAGEEVARVVCERAQAVQPGAGVQRSFLKGAAYALEESARARRRGGRELSDALLRSTQVMTDEAAKRIQAEAEEAAWYEGLGRAVSAAQSGDFTSGQLRHMALGITGALGSKPADVRT